MDCPRCKGAMVQETFEDLLDDTGHISFKGWRCLICGDIVDPLIARNRGSYHEPLRGHSRKKFALR